jgi:catechol-2,3-dioxygenase
MKVLNAHVVHETADGAFLTYDDEHHRIAVADPDGAAKAAAKLMGEDAEGFISSSGALSPEELAALPPHGLSHIAFTYETLEDLLATYERLKSESITPVIAINHGTTTSMYYADPDGNQIELQIDNFDSAAAGTAFMQSESFARNPIGVPFDPDKFLKRLSEGGQAADLVRPRW